MISLGMDLMTDATASPIPSTRVQTIMSDFIESNMNDDGVDRRGFLKCMAWAGTGVIWSINGGLLTSTALGQEANGRSGIKDEMPSFAKKYNDQDTSAIVAYLKTLH
jgi:hypothetical protein